MRDYRTTTEADAGDFERHYADRDDDRPTLAELERDEWEARQIADERESRTATPGEAHAEWHRNAGVPMGQPGCPQDACHPIEDFEPDPEPGEGIRCAHCKGRHWTVATVKECAREQARLKVQQDAPWAPLNTPEDPPF